MTSSDACNVFPHVDRYTRQGQQNDGSWVQRLESRVEAWASAHQNVAHMLGPHTDAWYDVYLHWFQARSRCQITYPAALVPPQVPPTVQDTYPRHRDQYYAGQVS
jgi:hypothetical protein